MGVAASNRGTRVVIAEIDARHVAPDARDVICARDARIVALERDLSRARRCIAELRRAAGERATRHAEAESRSQYAISLLTRIAFPGDHSEGAS